MHFVAAVVEDQRAPVGMLAQARIGVLVEMRAVELGQAVGVVGEVGRRPIENHAQALLMAAIHEVHEVGGRAVAAGGGEIADGLVAPGAVEGMLHDGQQLDVREAHLLDVGNQLVGQFAVGEPAIAFLAAPGAQMDFVDGNGLGQPVAARGARPSRRNRSSGSRRAKLQRSRNRGAARRGRRKDRPS